MKIEELNEDIESVDELENVLCDALDNYLVALWDEEGMTREPDEEDAWDYMKFWTNKAQKLIDAEFKELYAIAKKYDPDNCEDYDISSYMYREG